VRRWRPRVLGQPACPHPGRAAAVLLVVRRPGTGTSGEALMVEKRCAQRLGVTGLPSLDPCWRGLRLGTMRETPMARGRPTSPRSASLAASCTPLRGVAVALARSPQRARGDEPQLACQAGGLEPLPVASDHAVGAEVCGRHHQSVRHLQGLMSGSGLSGPFGGKLVEQDPLAEGLSEESTHRRLIVVAKPRAGGQLGHRHH